jgi:hypothetical protein
MKATNARLVLFLVWMGLWVMYVVMFFSTTAKAGVEYEQAIDAVWKVSYVLLPIVSAFGTYYFLPREGQDGPDMVDGPRCVAMFTITGVVNLIVLLAFLFGVLLPDFTAPNANYSYHDRVDTGIKVMLLLSSLVALPVGFLLGRPVKVVAEVPHH